MQMNMLKEVSSLNWPGRTVAQAAIGFNMPNSNHFVIGWCTHYFRFRAPCHVVTNRFNSSVVASVDTLAERLVCVLKCVVAF